MNKTTIEWTDYTWNPVTGCHKVSPGCKNCYAETMNIRFGKGRSFRDVQIHHDRLSQPIKMRKKLHGKKVFVCDVSDLFHESVPDEFISEVFGIMWVLPKTIFQVLTKRPERALQWAKKYELEKLKCKNIWIGVSVEDQQRADERIPLLLQIPAAVRFLSCEPLLGEIDLMKSLREIDYNITRNKRIDWLIVGGESGHGARPMNPDWVRALRNQCNAFNVPFLFKQWGHYAPLSSKGFFCIDETNSQQHESHSDHTEGMVWFEKRGKSKTGNLLDGVQHLNFPK